MAQVGGGVPGIGGTVGEVGGGGEADEVMGRGDGGGLTGASGEMAVVAVVVTGGIVITGSERPAISLLLPLWLPSHSR